MLRAETGLASASMTEVGTDPKAKSTPTRWWAVGLLAVLLLAGVGLGAFLIGRAARGVAQVTQAAEQVTGEGEFTRVAPVTIQSVQALSELTTVEFLEYTVVEKGDDRGWLNWATGDQIEMFAVARIAAGVDLANLAAEDILADPTTGTATIRLPAAEILTVTVDNEATHVYNRETGIFIKGDPNLERASRLAAEEVLTGQALEAGILELASDRAVVILTDLLTSLGYTDIEVVVSPAP